MCWDQGSLPRRSAYQLFLVSRPNRASVWCWTYKNVLPSPTYGVCFFFFPFFDCTIWAVLRLVSKHIGIFWVWMLKGSIQRDVNLTSFCSIAAEVQPVVVMILYLHVQSAVFKMSCSENSLRVRTLRFCFDHAMGQVAKSFLFSAHLPYLKLFCTSEKRERKGKLWTGPCSHSSLLDFI